MAGPGMISLTRNEQYSSLVAEEGTRMRQDCTFTDFKISSDNETFLCHKYVVCLHSPYLKALLTSDMVEAAKHAVTLDHISPPVITAILDYMYTGQISFHADMLMDMIRACDYLRMKELFERCVNEVTSVLIPSTAISWMKLADKLALPDITRKAKDMMVSDFKEISSQMEFLTLSYEEVGDYLSDVVRSENECDDTLHAAMRWVTHDPDNRHTHLETLLALIRLEDCTLPAVIDIMSIYEATIISSNVLKTFTESMRKITARSDAAKQKTVTTPQTVIVGGQVDGKASPVCWSLTHANQWVKLCDIPFQFARDHSVCQAPLGFVITGGVGSDLCILFIAATKSWSELPKMLNMRYGHGSICIRGKLYVFGAWQNGKGSKSVDYIVLKDGQWQSGPDLSRNVKMPKVANISDIVYLLDSYDTKQLLQLDAERGAWTERAPLPVKDECGDVSMSSVNGQLVVAGGGAKVCAWYHPATDSWSMGQKPQYWHCLGSLLCQGKTLLLLGGRRDVSNQGTNDVEEYNTEDGGSWSVSTIKMPASLCFHHALVLDIPAEQ